MIVISFSYDCNFNVLKKTNTFGDVKRVEFVWARGPVVKGPKVTESGGASQLLVAPRMVAVKLVE